MINHIILWLLGMLNLIYSIVILLNNKNIYYKYIDDKDKFYSSFEIRTMLCSIFPIISAVLLFVIYSNMNKFIEKPIGFSFMPLIILFISYCYTSFKITIKISDYRSVKFPDDDSIHSFIKYSSINVNFSLALPVLPLGFAITDLISGFASNFILME